MKLISNIDNSINIVEEQLQGFIEARYVRRTDDYFIAYLSSQTGCNRGCKFCHLTNTKQTKFDDVTLEEFEKQIDSILNEYYNSNNKARIIHFNFMARGEPLKNKYILEYWSNLFGLLTVKAATNKLYPKINISTIIPKDFNKSLIEIFGFYPATIYYSIYSVDPIFRRKWLPNALDVYKALDQLKEYQTITKKIIKFHCAFIKGENDNPDSVVRMMHAIKERNIVGEFNIVRYNPYSQEQGVETDQLSSIQHIIRDFMPVKIIPRVGEDVAASCGMFVE